MKFHILLSQFTLLQYKKSIFSNSMTGEVKKLICLGFSNNYYIDFSLNNVLHASQHVNFMRKMHIAHDYYYTLI